MRTNTKLLLVAILCSAQFISCKKEDMNTPAPPNSLSLDAAAIDSSLAKGMVAWYTFDGDTLDHSGNKNHIVFNSAKATKGKSGRARTAYVFDGATSYMMVNNSATLNPAGKITLYALVKPTGFYGGACHWNRILSKGNHDEINGRYMLGFSDQAYYNWDGCHAPLQPRFENFSAGYGDGIYASGNTDTYNNIKTNQWYTLVYTYDGTTSKLYINGVLVNKVVKSTTFNANTHPLSIGRHYDQTYPYFFKGVIDEIRIYKRALKANEVLRLYNVNN